MRQLFENILTFLTFLLLSLRIMNYLFNFVNQFNVIKTKSQCELSLAYY